MVDHYGEAFAFLEQDLATPKNALATRLHSTNLCLLGSASPTAQPMSRFRRKLWPPEPRLGPHIPLSFPAADLFMS